MTRRNAHYYHCNWSTAVRLGLPSAWCVITYQHPTCDVPGVVVPQVNGSMLLLHLQRHYIAAVSVVAAAAEQYQHDSVLSEPNLALTCMMQVADRHILPYLPMYHRYASLEYTHPVREPHRHAPDIPDLVYNSRCSTYLMRFRLQTRVI